MIFTNLEKYVYSKKCLKQRRQPPPPLPSSEVESIFAPKKSPCYGDITMPLSLKTIGSAGDRDQWNKGLRWV